MNLTRWYANVICLNLNWLSSWLLLPSYFHCFSLYLYVSCCMNKLHALSKIHQQLIDSNLKERCKRRKKCLRKNKWKCLNHLTKKFHRIFIRGSKILQSFSKGICHIINSIKKLKTKKLSNQRDHKSNQIILHYKWNGTKSYKCISIIISDIQIWLSTYGERN